MTLLETRLILEPHADDCALFCAYAALGGWSKIITVLGGDEKRAMEAKQAAQTLISSHEAWPISENDIDWNLLEAKVTVLASESEFDVVYAPIIENGGHEHHNKIGEIALSAFGSKVRFYATYKRGHGRTQTEWEVEPKDQWRGIKLRALSWFHSQIEDDNMRPWFASDDMLREWVRP